MTRTDSKGSDKILKFSDKPVSDTTVIWNSWSEVVSFASYTHSRINNTVTTE